MKTKTGPPRLKKGAFFRDIRYTPHPGQREIHESAAPRRIVACGVRWGKTLCAAAEGLAAAMEPKERSFGWVVAPTYDLCDKVFRGFHDKIGHTVVGTPLEIKDARATRIDPQGHAANDSQPSVSCVGSVQQSGKGAAGCGPAENRKLKTETASEILTVPLSSTSALF